MKFAKYLQNTETSEWRNAYIDYRGLKRLIKAVEFSRKGYNIHLPDISTSGQPFSSIAEPRPSEVDPHADERSLEGTGSQCPHLPPLNFSVLDLAIEPYNLGTERRKSSSIPSEDPMDSMQTCSSDTSSSLSGRGIKVPAQSNDTRHFMDPLVELPLHEILTQLTPQELTFFSMLDAQLNKVESFYLAREKEVMARSFVLINQLEYLKDHREVFLETNTKKWWTVNISLSSLRHRTRLRHWQTPSQDSQQPDKGQVLKLILSPAALGDRYNRSSQCSNLLFMPALPASYRHGFISPTDDEWSKAEGTHLSLSPDDPSSYIPAKMKLKKAVSEHYRGLETLQQYRVLNVTGFRKAVKKFEKITKIPVQKQYFAEKVGNCAFASDDAIIRNMTREMEEIYASVFTRGDKKEALKRLRPRPAVRKSYHFSTFRSGLLIGFAISALIDGLLKAQQPETQQAIPCWDILLFLYGLIFVPVLYSFLLGFNFMAWDRFRINYEFILDLKVSSRFDYRQYFEIPSLLLAMLCFAFWASFSRLGEPTFQFTTWPLIWLTFAIFILVHPIPLMAKSSRYWFIKIVLKLFLSGMRPVEFADFWMGDQLSSLIFTLSNAPLFVCVYLDKFSDDWQKCKNNSSRMWPISFALASIPFIIRLAQCVKRYADSKLVTHLINAGKYGAGIVNYLFYFMWTYRQQNRGPIFVMWCVINTFYSIYACSWDFLMDYSVLQPHSKHLFLRTELMYVDHQWVYYFAMLSNLLIRFIWVIYIPQAGPAMMVRSFIAGMFEMLRRLQWNFFRFESEHVSNMDQYRVTREMPLPYPLDFEIREEPEDDDADDDDDDTLYAEP